VHAAGAFHSVSQWEREAIGECTRDAMNHKRTKGERVGNIQFGN
jgi:DNA invertase Pin-like site-specific DNA recombinase